MTSAPQAEEKIESATENSATAAAQAPETRSWEGREAERKHRWERRHEKTQLTRPTALWVHVRCNCDRLTREAQGVAGICSVGAGGNAFAGSRGQQTVPPSPKEMSSIACPTHWTRVHNASTSRKWCDGVKCALALDGRALPGGRLGSEKVRSKRVPSVPSQLSCSCCKRLTPYSYWL